MQIALTTTWHARTHHLDTIDQGSVKTLRSEVAQQGFAAFKMGNKEYRASVDEAGKIKVQRNWDGSSLLARLFKPLQGHCSRELTRQLDGMNAAERKTLVHERHERSAIYAQNFALLCEEIKARVSSPSVDKEGFFRVPGSIAGIDQLTKKMGERAIESFSEYDAKDLIGVIKASKHMVDVVLMDGCVIQDADGNVLEIDGEKAAKIYREQVQDSSNDANQKRCRDLAASTMAFCYKLAADGNGESFNKSNLYVGSPLVCSTSSDEKEVALSKRMNREIFDHWTDSVAIVEGKGKVPPAVPPKPQKKPILPGGLHNASMDAVVAQLRSNFNGATAK